MLQFLKHHIGWTILSAIVLVAVLFVAHQIQLENTVRTVTVHVSGLPAGSKITVGRAPGPAIFQHASNPLAERRSGNTVTVHGSNLESIVVDGTPPVPDICNGDCGDGVRYLPTKKQYNVVGKPAINVHFKKYYTLTSSGGWSSLPGQGGIAGVSPIIHPTGYFGGHSLYPAGSIVTVSAPKVMAQVRFAWWYIFNPNEVHTTYLYDFTTTKRTLRIKMTHPYDVDAFYAGDWATTKKYRHAPGIVVENVLKGQVAELVRKGQPPIVARRRSTKKQGQPQVLIPLSAGQTVSGRILITAPDGKTKVFESPYYPRLVAGDTFFF